MSPIDLHDSLGTIAAHSPAATQIFLRNRLDFCCGGHRSLADACADRQLDPQAIASEIETRSAGVQQRTWGEAHLAELVDFVVDVYHAELRASLPALITAAHKVERVHRDKPDCPHGLGEHLDRIALAVEAHLHTEETVLFPAIKAQRLAGSGATSGDEHDLVGQMVNALVDEHDEHGQNLARTRELAHDLVPPPEACRTWRALYAGLEELETSLMEHVHLENHVLFPRALARS